MEQIKNEPLKLQEDTIKKYNSILGKLGIQFYNYSLKLKIIDDVTIYSFGNPITVSRNLFLKYCKTLDQC